MVMSPPSAPSPTPVLKVMLPPSVELPFAAVTLAPDKIPIAPPALTFTFPSVAETVTFPPSKPIVTALSPEMLTFSALTLLSISIFWPAYATLPFMVIVPPSAPGIGSTAARLPFAPWSFWTPVMTPAAVTVPPWSEPSSPPFPPPFPPLPFPRPPSSSVIAPSGMLKVIVAPLGAEAMVRLSAPDPPKAARTTSLALIEPLFATDLPTRYANLPALMEPSFTTLPDPSLENTMPSGPFATLPTAAATSPLTLTLDPAPKRMPLGLRI